MIIVNGYIQFKKKGEIRYDENQFPIAGEVSLSSYIPCQYITSQYGSLMMNNIATSNGEHYKMAKYEILIDSYYHKDESETIVLYDRGKKLIGEFPIVSSELLDAVLEIRIIV